MDLGRVLWAFADLTPSGPQQVLDVTASGHPLAWDPVPRPRYEVLRRVRLRATDSVKRLTALDALHRDERILRQGWTFLVGNAEVEGKRRRFCLPMISQPCRIERALDGYWLIASGDRELSELVSNEGLARRLEADPHFTADHAQYPPPIPSSGMMTDSLDLWVHKLARAAGVRIDRIDGPSRHPSEWRDHDGLVALVGHGIYVGSEVTLGGLGSSLRQWAGVPYLDRSVLAHLYGSAAHAGMPVAGTEDGSDEQADATEVLSPLPLSSEQAEAVGRTRSAPLTVISGAPGCGKSHTVVAAAVDAVSRGESVLVVTRSVHAAEVLGELLDRHPGPTPVLFGSAERREEIAARFERGVEAPVSRSHLATARRRLDGLLRRRERLRRAARTALEREQRAASFEEDVGLLLLLAADVPGAFERDADLEALGELAEEALLPPTGWWSARRSRRAERHLRRRLRPEPGIGMTEILEALELARSRRASAELVAGGGTSLSALWQQLESLEAAIRSQLGQVIDLERRSPAALARQNRRAVGALARALRAGRSTRRALFQAVHGPSLLGAFPLWVGTLRDVEQLLPPTPGLFDVVILDEASQIPQHEAVLALARGRRGVVAGDPHQLRHVSFVGDVEAAGVLAEHGLEAMADVLDLRRNSALDVAAAAAPVLWLRGHYRSVPHLIEFSADRFYGDRLQVLTRHPRTERTRAIQVAGVRGVRDGKGVNEVEVDAVLALLRQHLVEGAASVGVISPFRAQADALEERMLAELSLDEIEQLGLRTGTVHRFQGSERDLVVVSLALDEGSPPGSRRFVEDPNLFNVMVTRAREQLVLVTSVPHEEEGLIGEYLAYARRPPVPPSTGRGDDWTEALAAELRRSGQAVRTGYPVGHWRIDIVLGGGDEVVGLECGVHPEGPEAHVERHLALRDLGWTLLDAYRTRWDGNATRGALDLLAHARDGV